MKIMGCGFEHRPGHPNNKRARLLLLDSHELGRASCGDRVARLAQAEATCSNHVTREGPHRNDNTYLYST